MYPANNVVMPIESLNCDKVTATAKELTQHRAPNTDKTTATDLRIELDGMREKLAPSSDRVEGVRSRAGK